MTGRTLLHPAAPVRVDRKELGLLPLRSYPAARRLLLALTLLLALAACSGLGGEPRIVSTQIPATRIPQDVGYPLTPPDLALGAQVFADNCTACHGQRGAGDGEVVLSGQIEPPPDFTDPTTAAAQTPAEIFDVVTHGRMEKLMPPWRGVLSEAERWAVTHYVYTLAYRADDIQNGAALYASACAECHGPAGAGDGERAAEFSRPLGDMSNAQQMVTLSDDALYTIITEGQGEQMPAFADNLTDAQRRAVTRFVRTLSLANADAIGSAPLLTSTAEATAAAEATELPASLSVHGQLVNGTAGGEQPAALPVLLYRLEDTPEGIRDESFAATSDEDGTFTFADIPLDATSSYIISATYRDRLFTSEVYSASELLAADGLTLTVYEPTEDPGVIRITSITTTVDVIGDGLQVLQEFIFENSSDRVYTNSMAVGENAFASVVVGLPPGAAGLAFAGAANRFVTSQEQQVVVDTVPVWPGRAHTIQLSYFIPYDDGAVIDQPVYFSVDGSARVFVWPPGIGFRSDQLTSAGQQTHLSDTYALYQGDLTLSPGDSLIYELSGSAESSVTAQTTPVSSNSTLLLVGGLLLEVLLIVGVLYWYFRRRSRANAAPPDRSTQIDTIIRRIADLDNRHDAGGIDDADYERQRTGLKARLAELMSEEDGR